MHFNDFLQLNETEQVELLWYNGEQIGRRKEEDYLILLYQVEGFYVEVFYHRKERMIKRYLSFDCSDSRLDTYLEKVDISPIYKHTRKPSRISDVGMVNYLLNIANDKGNDPVKNPRKKKWGIWDRFFMLFQLSKK
jgi:hypothetical protein